MIYKTPRALYGGSEFYLMRAARGWTSEVAAEKARVIRNSKLRMFDTSTIRKFRLDNPFMSDDARKVMMNQARRKAA